MLIMRRCGSACAVPGLRFASRACQHPLSVAGLPNVMSGGGQHALLTHVSTPGLRLCVLTERCSC